MGEEGKKERWGEDEFGPYRIDDRPWTMNEIRDHPLFMEHIPDDISDNPHLLAMQSLIYDGQTNEEMADHFRKLGNEAFRLSENKIATQNALMSYTKGLEMECKDESLNSQLHSNRAAVSLRMKEYSKAVDDCRKASKLDPKNMKAFYRGAKASETLGLTEQALKFCKGALGLKPEDKELRQILQRLEKKQAEEAEQNRIRDRSLQHLSNEQTVASNAVKATLDSRGMKVGPILFNVVMYFEGKQPEPQLCPDACDAVQWPLLLLYDETNQSDFVETFDERCPLEEQLELMFPKDRKVEWDEEGKYVWDRLVAYLEIYPEEGRDTKMHRIPTSSPLMESLQALHVPKCLVVHILVADSGALASFCREHHL